ncbi:hypothetical protein THAOC_32284, partial [Thalassiosira oceanica]
METSSQTRSFEARRAQSKLARTGSASISSPISAREALATQRRTPTSELCLPLCRSLASGKTTWEPTSTSTPTATPCIRAEIAGFEPPDTPQILSSNP